ncbi:hypothetical protein B0T18DRAFT_314319 [Schizothecium vesticola]|uniref:Uncharacterized protein n=1 Tax=Schizothecium vesticola TaxID=314040 RepID=A0AA40F9X0_9PEZI|nr:hypothetical protein B0T18DRAFT_314319 [Schizothecium vesticola]
MANDSTPQGPFSGYATEFLLAPEDETLGIRNDSRVNRSLAASEHIGRSGFSAYLRHVQYGLYQSRPACLVAVDFSFRFPTNSSSRFSSAEVEVTFDKALDRSKPSLRCADASLDPVVANFAPKQLLGRVRERESCQTFEITAPVTFEVPFGSAEFAPRWARETTMTEEGQTELHGNLAQDDEHDDGANSVAWDLTENPISKGGILRTFRGVVLLFHRPAEAFWMRVDVKPVVKFSLDPKRLFTKRMVGRGDEPILLDGETTLGDTKCHSCDAFDADDFPWDAILNLPGQLGDA